MQGRDSPVKESAVNEQPSWDVEGDRAPLGPVPDEETLVADPRGKMTPAELLDRKLVAQLLPGAVPVSMVSTERYTGR
jgi:hypothetical protein